MKKALLILLILVWFTCLFTACNANAVETIFGPKIYLYSPYTVSNSHKGVMNKSAYLAQFVGTTGAQLIGQTCYADVTDYSGDKKSCSFIIEENGGKLVLKMTDSGGGERLFYLYNVDVNSFDEDSSPEVKTDTKLNSVLTAYSAPE